MQTLWVFYENTHTGVFFNNTDSLTNPRVNTDCINQGHTWSLV